MSLLIAKLLAFLHLNHKCYSCPQKKSFSNIREQTGSRIHHVPMSLLKNSTIAPEKIFPALRCPKMDLKGIF